MPRTYDPEKLKIDCDNCDVLCCVAYKLDYPDFKKMPGVACPNLNTARTQCTIFDKLEERGYGVCKHHDCRGAGPAVSKLFRSLGRTWLTDPSIGNAEFRTMTVVFYTLLRDLYPDRMKGVLDLSEAELAEVQPFVDAALDLMTLDPPETIEKR